MCKRNTYRRKEDKNTKIATRTIPIRGHYASLFAKASYTLGEMNQTLKTGKNIAFLSSKKMIEKISQFLYLCFTKLRISSLTLVIYLKRFYLEYYQVCVKRTSPNTICWVTRYVLKHNNYHHMNFISDHKNSLSRSQRLSFRHKYSARACEGQSTFSNLKVNDDRFCGGWPSVTTAGVWQQ